MADETAATSTPASTGSTDWSAQATDMVVNVVDSVKAKTTGPALTVVRALVYGVIVMFVGLAVLALFVIGLVRFVNSYLPGDVWATHLLLGSIFTIAGLVLWSRRPKG